MSAGMGFLAFIVLFILLMGSCIWVLNYEKQMKFAKERKVIPQDWLSRDYRNIPGIDKCPRCGSEAHLTTTVDIPSIQSEPDKLLFNKYEMKLVYSVRCNNCSLGTSNREELGEVMNDWNSQRIAQQ